MTFISRVIWVVPDTLIYPSALVFTLSDHKNGITVSLLHSFIGAVVLSLTEQVSYPY